MSFIKMIDLRCAYVQSTVFRTELDILGVELGSLRWADLSEQPLRINTFSITSHTLLRSASEEGCAKSCASSCPNYILIWLFHPLQLLLQDQRECTQSARQGCH